MIKARASPICTLKASIRIKISVKKSGESGIQTRSMRLIINNLPVKGILCKRLLIFSKSHVFIFMRIFPADINEAVLRKLCQIICNIPSLIPRGPSHKAKTMIHIFSLLE